MPAPSFLHLIRVGERLVLHAADEHHGAAVYAGATPEAIDRRRPVAHVRGGEGTELPALLAAERPFLAVALRDGGEEIVAERLVPLEGAQNFRDLGGYPAAGGARVRWGRVFRSDSLASLTSADLARLERLGLRLVLDFRGDAEVEEEPNQLAGRPAIDYRRQPLGDRSVQPAEWRRRFEAGDFAGADAAWLTRSYRGMIDDCAAEFGAVLRRLAEASALPAVFHCTAGKDRTGVASALLLLLLGVSRAHVLEDYALTALYTAGRIRSAERFFAGRGVDPAQVRGLLGSEPETLAGALDHLDAAHGGVERWARERAGLGAGDLTALREALLGGLGTFV